jgi:hypothetical protein
MSLHGPATLSDCYRNFRLLKVISGTLKIEDDMPRIFLPKIFAVLSATAFLAACGAGSTTAPIQPEVPAGVGTAAQHASLSGPPGCSNAIAEYEKIVDRDVTTGYLSQGVYDQIIRDINAGPRPACASGRDANGLAELARVKKAHGYR